MDIKEMHKAFLVLGQQMGLQNMRNILPNEIDVFINAAIVDEVRKAILTNVNTAFGDKVTIQRNTISPINFIRTLYTSKSINVATNKIIADDTVIMYYTSIWVSYENNDDIYQCRLIEPDELANTLRDYCNGASFDYPIATLINEDPTGYVWTIYSGIKKPNKAVINFIRNPNKVDYENNISCDLPKYTHNQIVEAAIAKYFPSVGSTTN